MKNIISALKSGWKSLAVILVATLGSGALVAFLTRDSMIFYDTLNKPSFAPPGWLFPVAWSILYTLMAISIWLILRTGDPRSRMLLALYVAQLIVNLLWPVLFFVQEALGLAFVWLVLLWALILILMTRSFRVKPLAGWLLTPYLGWVTFAGVLNFVVAHLNR